MFLDTSGLFSLFDHRNAFHSAASRFFDEENRMLTHNYVLSEFIALANARHLHRENAQLFVSDIMDNPLVEIFWVSESHHRSAMIFLSRRLDKDYSLCDAVSFMQMTSNGEREALTTDHHFEQEGFIRLLK
ncbi:MAG: type II toxin-antitoxin system VapC family toxin [Pirellulales bacterium]|nr:type II toxin-antitoxin system VapC family toxin [Pirellulales bacterium]